MPLSTTQKFRWGLYSATVLAGLIVVIGFVNTTALTRRSTWVLRTSSIVTELEVLEAELADAETGQRGFLLTGDRRYLEPYLRAAPAVDQHVARLGQLLADDSQQRAALDSLKPLIRTKLAELDRSIMSVFFQDVTERIEAERRAREGDERLRVALEAGRFGVWEWDMVGDRLAWSDRTHELHGIPVGSFGGRLEDFTTLVHPEDLTRVSELLQTAIRDRIPYEVEFRVRHPDGSVHWLATAGRVLYAPDHRPSRMLGVIWERTQQRLQEETARHAQRMEAIGRLAGGIAHEVNNQMSVVLGFSQFVLKRADLPADVHSDMAEIHRAGERSAAITSQLLAFSRRQLLRPERLDLTDVVSRFERVMKRTVGEGCDLTLRLGATLPRVEADRGQVEQVLLNLALNAADAMPDGGSLTISTTEVQLPHDAAALAPGVPVVSGAYVRLTVTDTGHGMDASVLRHVFEPFFTTKPMGKGTGLGLSTVYGIMKQSGGYVWVDSDRGTGTSVHLDFPVAKAASDSEASEPAFRPTPARGLVMVVEDEPAVRAMVSRVLQEEGYEVVAARDGQEALSALADRNGVRLVVSDVAMPVMSGRELGDRLARTHPGLPGPVHVGLRRRGDHLPRPARAGPALHSEALRVGDVRPPRGGVAVVGGRLTAGSSVPADPTTFRPSPHQPREGGPMSKREDQRLAALAKKNAEKIVQPKGDKSVQFDPTLRQRHGEEDPETRRLFKEMKKREF